MRSQNESYRGFKMIEPLCLDRLHLIASKERPLLRAYTKFSDHLNQKIDELLSEKVDMRAMRDYINQLQNPYELNNLFCTFRLFMHPFIGFQAGLIKLHQQVHLEKDIDVGYAEQLASDIALRLIDSQFQKRKQWPWTTQRWNQTTP